LLIGALLEDLDAREPGFAALQTGDADPPKRRVRANLHPQRRVGAGQYLVGEPELIVDLHGAGLYRKRPRLTGRSRLLVDYHHRYAAAGQHQPGHQASRACAHDQDVSVGRRQVGDPHRGHRALLRSDSPPVVTPVLVDAWAPSVPSGPKRYAN
jgi:hypothetical protein